MDTIKINVDGIDFEFRAEETIRDKMEIENEVAYLVGDRLKLAQLRSSIDEAVSLYLEWGRKKYGDEFDKKRERFNQLIAEKQTDTEEYNILLKELCNNTYYRTFMELQLEKNKIYSYARLNVLCVKKPNDFDFYKQSEEYLDKIVTELEKSNLFFRK